MLKIEVTAKDIMLIWNCFAQAIQHSDMEEKEVEMLMEVMDSLGQQHRVNTTKPYNLKLTLDQYKSCWHMIKICRDEELIPKYKDSQSWTVFAKIADIVDKTVTMDLPPLALLESRDDNEGIFRT